MDNPKKLAKRDTQDKDINTLLK